MSESFHAGLIAGTHSGAGKTTWSLALMALAREKGLTVQPFKVGPDYIDPGFHHQVCLPRKSRNLDLYFLSEEGVKESFRKNSQSAGLAVVEGVMGLFDGKGVSGGEGSSAHIAKFLGLPVFLVIDGSAMAASAAALVLGFQQFDPELKLSGIFINRVNHERHFALLKQAIEAKTGIPVLGYLPKEESLGIPERHLGLTTALESSGTLEKIQRAVELLKTRLDWDRFLAASIVAREKRSGLSRGTWKALFPMEWEIRPESSESRSIRHSFFAARTFPSDNPERFSREPRPAERFRRKRGNGSSATRIGVAYDAAFSFYYEDNFDLLREAGAELVFFSPLADQTLPPDVDWLYFGGGFPELYAPALSENRGMMESVRRFYRDGGSIYAECGGLIYLSEAFRHKNGAEHPLAGLVPGKIRMTDRLQHFGYHELTAEADTFLFPKGKTLRSHEFHYSAWDMEGKVPPVYRIGDRREGFAGERLTASYQHLHFRQLFLALQEEGVLCR